MWGSAVTDLFKRECGQVDAERTFDYNDRTIDSSSQCLDARKRAKENLLEVQRNQINIM